MIDCCNSVIHLNTTAIYMVLKLTQMDRSKTSEAWSCKEGPVNLVFYYNYGTKQALTNKFCCEFNFATLATCFEFKTLTTNEHLISSWNG